jgi:hypothetical protein
MVGKNIDAWLQAEELPRSVSKYGTTPEQIFVTYEELKAKFGADFKQIPLGAVGLYTFSQKFRVGLQQLMAGSRNFNLSLLSRDDLMALTEEAAKVSGIAYVMDARRAEAEKILAE